MEKFGQKLRVLRLQRRLTLKELATDLGYDSHSYISELESGKKLPSVDLVVALSRFFNVTTDQLLKDELSVEQDVDTDNDSDSQEKCH
jgi:transcriptional regulator with XRE-family HTH domain